MGATLAARSGAGVASSKVTPSKVTPSQRSSQVSAVSELLIDKWRLQRIEIRRLLLQVLSGELLAFSATEQTQALQSLCSELIDYVSHGHFEIYGRVLPRRLRGDAEFDALLQHIFDSIGKSTDAVLDFNERYQRSSIAPATPFRQLLLRLSRSLLLRFALEEQLLELCGH